MLKLSGLSKTYPGNIPALQDIHLTIEKGMFGLLGPNGAGKSTLMRTIATLQEPDTGSITFDGIDALRDKNSLRQALGYLPQEFGAYPRTSAASMLKHFAALKGIHGQDRDCVVEDVLVKTNLWDVKDRSVDKFSGGMKQRYGIAQALLGNPKLIIVDEPTAGLDPVERRRFQNLLVELGEEVVVLLSTHIVDDVEDICPRIAIMAQGRILLTGESAALVSSLKGKLWSCLSQRSQLAELRSKHRVVSTRIRAGGVEVKVFQDDSPQSMSAAEPKLEDVYFNALLANDISVELE
jgi:ABC-type multidrug transport system ATPase subunit